MLRIALRLDALVTGANALAYLTLAGPLSDLLGVPASALRGIGGFLAVFAIAVWMTARPAVISRPAAGAIAVANLTWAAGSVVALALERLVAGDRRRGLDRAAGGRRGAVRRPAAARAAARRYGRSRTGSVLSWLTNGDSTYCGVARRARSPGSARASPRSGSAAPGARAPCRGRSAGRRRRTPGARGCGVTSKRSGSS